MRVGGSCDAALPLVAATLLASEPSTLHDLPRVTDVADLLRTLSALGVSLVDTMGGLRIDAATIARQEIPWDPMHRPRGGALLLGPLLAQKGSARVPLPAGGALAIARFDDHVRALVALGARATIERGELTLKKKRLAGAHITLAFPSLTTTASLMMAATRARGRTTIEGAARGPELEDLGLLLNKMGGTIEGAGSSLVTVSGVDELRGVEHTVAPDRWLAATLLLAAALTGGDVLVENAPPESLDAVLARTRRAGVDVQVEAGGVRARATEPLSPIDVTAQRYPDPASTGFPTALLPHFIALAARAEGESLFTAPASAYGAIDDRHLGELRRLGVKLTSDGRTTIVHGPSPLTATPIVAHDPRASASLVLAALAADGETLLHAAERLARRCEDLDAALRSLGADVSSIDK